MGSRGRRGQKPEPGGRALPRQRPVGTIHRPRRYGRAIYPARGGHNTRPLNAHGSLGNYLRQESPLGLSSGGVAKIVRVRYAPGVAPPPFFVGDGAPVGYAATAVRMDAVSSSRAFQPLSPATPAPRSETRSSPAISRRQRPDHVRQGRRVRRAFDRHPDPLAECDPDRRRRCRHWPRHSERRGRGRRLVQVRRNTHRHKRRRLPLRRNCRRQRYRRLATRPSRRAISVTTAPGSSIAATSRAFSAALHRRRRSTDVMTSTDPSSCG